MNHLVNRVVLAGATIFLASGGRSKPVGDEACALSCNGKRAGRAFRSRRSCLRQQLLSADDDERRFHR
jgi:hypothetical protein